MPLPESSPRPPAPPRPPRSPFSLSIVLPCRNEAANLERIVARCLRLGRPLADPLELIVVDDGSEDATFELADALAATHPELRIVRNARSRGYGGALSAGLRSARMDWVFYTDGDGQFELSELASLPALLEGHDVVVGYRAIRRDGWLRGLYGRAFSLATDVLLDLELRDVNCAFKVFPRQALEQIEMESEGAFIDAEVMVQLRDLGLRIAQIPVSHLPRSAGRQTGGDPRVMARALIELGSSWWRRSAARGGSSRDPAQEQTRLRPPRFAS